MIKKEERTQEQIDWDNYVKSSGLKTIPIPYALSVYAITIGGILYLNDPLKESSTEGAFAGAVNGTYSLNKNNTEAKFYDPTGQLLRAVLVLDFSGNGELRVRVDTRRWDGKWNEGSWAILWRG